MKKGSDQNYSQTVNVFFRGVILYIKSLFSA